MGSPDERTRTHRHRGLTVGFPLGAQASPAARYAAHLSSAEAAPLAASNCFANFSLIGTGVNYDTYTAEAIGDWLYFSGSADEFCQERVSINNTNVIIYDIDALNNPSENGYCLAYTPRTGTSTCIQAAGPSPMSSGSSYP